MLDVGTVTLGTFCHTSIGRQLHKCAEDSEQYPLVIKCEGKISRYVLQRGKVLIETQDEDEVVEKTPSQRGRKSITKTRLATNYLKVTKGMKFGRDYAPLEDNGYVFNSSNRLWQASTAYAMTPEKAKIFLLSCRGYLPDVSFSRACEICLTSHFVKIDDDGEAICDCAAYCSHSECGHATAALHLEGVINIGTELQQIQSGRLPGRPKNYKAVGFSASAPQPEVDNTARLEASAPKYYGMRVARRFPDDDRVYMGTVFGK
jgi:hypothetical protein